MNGTRLTIVIPALNEEEAIGETITRCLNSREHIRNVGQVEDVEIIVVSDGSTDRTAEIAGSFDEVQLIVFPENRGYGAAIREGWNHGSGEWLGFLDADGTCDPNYFGAMCRIIQTKSADIVLGSRMGPDSRMPWLRRVGNRLFALLLGFLCGRFVSDTASGMRVVRRTALPELVPLPDGLHFTPAMSARALMNQLTVVEIPMRYEERIGNSKLSVVKDGVRFLQAILDGVLCYRPEKIFLTTCAICWVVIVLLSVTPVEFYWANGRLEEWMLYRFVVCSLLGSFALLLLSAAALSNRLAFLSGRHSEAVTFWAWFSSAIFRRWTVVPLAVGLSAAAMGFLWPGITEYMTTRTVSLHWSRLLAGAFGIFSAFQLAVFAVLMRVAELWRLRSEYKADTKTVSIGSVETVCHD